MIKHVRDLTLHQEVTVMRVIKDLDDDGSGSTGLALSRCLRDFCRSTHLNKLAHNPFIANYNAKLP